MDSGDVEVDAIEYVESDCNDDDQLNNECNPNLDEDSVNVRSRCTKWT